MHRDIMETKARLSSYRLPTAFAAWGSCSVTDGHWVPETFLGCLECFAVYPVCLHLARLSAHHCIATCFPGRVARVAVAAAA